MNLPVLTASAVRDAERRFPRELADGTLMDRAAMAVATEAMAMLRETGSVVGRTVLLLVGGGDNGGDALMAGARLARRGARVVAVPLAARMHGAGAHALQAAGGRITDAPGALALFDRLDLAIDGIVGIGSTRPLAGDAALLARALADAAVPTLAIDLPSGVHADTGAVTGTTIRADRTVTFGALRRAHVIAPAALRCGDVHVADIGVPMASDDVAVTSEDGWFAAAAPDVDKYARGVAGVVTGSVAYPGAAILSSAAAARSGCGMVRNFGPTAPMVVAAHPMVVPAGRADIVYHPRTQAWLVGCGIGTDADAAAAVQAVLDMPHPVVLDADALTVVANNPALRTKVRDRIAPTLITPHAGEAMRLAEGLGCPIDLDADRLGGAQAIARALAVVVLLKGPTTIVTDGTRWIATPPLGSRLATAGSGDVLAGIIVGALARWEAEAPLGTPEVMAIAAAAAVRHARAARGGSPVATDLLDGLDAGQ